MTTYVEPIKMRQLPEDTWLAMTPEAQDAYWKGAMALAAADPNARKLCLRLTPDPVFPATDHTVPYIVRQEDIFENVPDMWVEVSVVVWIRGDLYDTASEKQKLNLRAAARLKAQKATPPGGSFAIHTNAAGCPLVERGKVG